ncbi:unnamed protein product, partial [Prorocentrum cordatum]
QRSRSGLNAHWRPPRGRAGAMQGLPPDRGRGGGPALAEPQTADCGDCAAEDCADCAAAGASDCAAEGAAAPSGATAVLPVDTSSAAFSTWPPQWTYCPPCDIQLAGREDARDASGGAAEGDRSGASAPVAVSEPMLGSWGGALAGVLKGGGGRRNGPLGAVLGHMACAVFGCTCER